MPSGIPELGEVLRRWRVQVAAVKATDSAAAIGFGRSAISNWESGRRQPGHAQIERLDRAYGAGGALSDVAFALETPAALTPRRVWWHNCPPGGAAVWAWIRPHPGAPSPTATAYWGAFRCDVPAPLTPVGAVLAAASSVPNPPIKVVLDPPGWVDFGRGVFPGALGVAVTSVAEQATLADLATNVRAVLPRLARRDLGHAQRRLVRAVHELLGQPTGAAEAAIAALEHDHVEFVDLTGEAPRPPAPTPAPELDGAAYRRLRLHRRMSRSEVAAEASALLAAHPVSEDQLELLEAGGRPRVARLGSRLDMIYRAGGHTVTELVAAHPDPSGGLSVEFPRYWVGPVWVTLLGPPAKAGALTLEWPPWHKNLCARAGSTVTFRRSVTTQAPLTMRLQRGWTAMAGMGHVESAIDVNDGWQTIDDTHAQSVFPQIYSAYLGAFGLSHPELMALLRSLTETPEGRGSEDPRP